MRYGEFKKGIISRTNGQIKKHISQMSNSEILFLENKLHSLDKNSIVISDHIHNKFIGDDLDVVKELPFKDNVKDLIIEYNERPMETFIDRRILVRSKESYDVNIKGENVSCNICVVYSIVTNKVITIYWNNDIDNHNTINMNRYNKDLKIIY